MSRLYGGLSPSEENLMQGRVAFRLYQRGWDPHEIAEAMHVTVKRYYNLTNLRREHVGCFRPRKEAVFGGVRNIK